MQVSGVITELDQSQRERTIKIHLRGAAKPVWVSPEYQHEVKNLQLGEQVSFEVRDGRDYYFFQSCGERASANVSQNHTSPEDQQKPPLTTSSEIVTSPPKLPDSIPELQQFVLVTREALNVFRSKLAAVTRLNLAQAVRQQALEDGQRTATALLWAEAKLGELLKGMDLAKGAATQRGSPRGTALADLGISRKQSHFAQQLAGHKDLIEESIKEAIENEDIPTRSLVLQKIKTQEQTPKPPVETGKIAGKFKCPECGEHYDITHEADGRHRLRFVEVLEK